MSIRILFLTVVLIGLGGETRAQTPLSSPPVPSIDAAFQSAQLAIAPGSGPALAEGVARAAATDPELIALFDASREAEQERRALETVLVTLLAQGAPAQARAQGVSADLDKAILTADQALERLKTAYPRFVEMMDPDPLSIRQAQALLGPTDALLLILPAERGTFVWAVTPTGSQWTRSDLTAAEVGALAETLVQSLTASSGRGAVDAARRGPAQRQTFEFDAARRLYDGLWAPIAPTLAGVETVYVVTSGPLRSVPLGVLLAAPLPDSRDRPDLGALPWLQRRHAFVTLPTVSGLRALGRQTPFAQHAFIGYGDVRLQDFPDDAAAKSLPALPATRTELLQLARTLGSPRSAIHLGRTATEASFKSADLQGVSVVALATHAVSPENGTSEASGAYLVFTPPAQISGSDDGRLTAAEAASLRLTADLVILSACDTERDDPEATGIDSLSRAFLYAGARSLLVSNWRIRDDVAARLSSRAVQIAVQERVGIAQALHRATLEMMDDRRDRSFAHPSNWAAFGVLGDGGVRLGAGRP